MPAHNYNCNYILQLLSADHFIFDKLCDYVSQIELNLNITRTKKWYNLAATYVSIKLDINIIMERNGAREMEERRCIRDTGKALKKYGSTAKHTTRTDSLIKHIVSSTDTLQGIALKYGVTTEQIRRVNRLWASDSLFLREHLLIPVSPDASLLLSTDETTEREHDAERDAVQISSPSSISSSVDEEGSVNDFLAKMDSSIANAKKEVKRAQGNSEFCIDGNDSYVHLRKTSNRLRNSLPVTSSSSFTISPPSETLRPSSSSDMHNFSTAVVMTQGRKVKTSLQRLQQQQDEMFQL